MQKQKEKIAEWHVEPLNTYTNTAISDHLNRINRCDENFTLSYKGAEKSTFRVPFSFITKLQNLKRNSDMKFNVYCIDRFGVTAHHRSKSTKEQIKKEVGAAIMNIKSSAA